MEGVARKQQIEPPPGYGYHTETELGVGCFVDENTKCRVLEKPVSIPSGKRERQGYMMMYGYCQKAGMVSILEGQIPPIMPCTMKDPKQFNSLVDIADNFGNKNPEAAKGNSEYCVAFRVPSELATQAETPGRDIWMVRFDQDVVSPFLQAAQDGADGKVNAAMSQRGGDRPGEVCDEHGVSALMMAAFGGHEGTCRALLAKGADVNAV
jgi:hypothetical protein